MIKDKPRKPRQKLSFEDVLKVGRWIEHRREWLVTLPGFKAILGRLEEETEIITNRKTLRSLLSASGIQTEKKQRAADDRRRDEMLAVVKELSGQVAELSVRVNQLESKTIHHFETRLNDDLFSVH